MIRERVIVLWISLLYWTAAFVFVAIDLVSTARGMSWTDGMVVTPLLLALLALRAAGVLTIITGIWLMLYGIWVEASRCMGGAIRTPTYSKADTARKEQIPSKCPLPSGGSFSTWGPGTPSGESPRPSSPSTARRGRIRRSHDVE